MSEQTLREALKELCDCCSSGFSGYVTGSPEDAKWEERKADAIDRAIAALSAPVAQPVAMIPVEILDRFPEINPSNYDHDDVCDLNSWGVEVVMAATEPKDKP